MSEKSLDIQKVINYLNFRRFGDLRDHIEENRHIVVYLYLDQYNYVAEGSFSPLDVSSTETLLADVANRIAIIKEYTAEIALFWFTYFLDRHSYYSDLYTLFYYVPSVAFISSLSVINDVKKVAEKYNLKLRYYGELYYNMPAREYLAIGEGDKIKYEDMPPFPELVKPEEVFAWVIGESSFPKDAEEVRKIENAYNQLLLNVAQLFGSDADEIVSLRQKIRTAPDVFERDKYFREVIKKVSDAERKMADAIKYIERESTKFILKTPVTIVRPREVNALSFKAR